MRQSEKLYDVYAGELLAQAQRLLYVKLVILFFVKGNSRARADLGGELSWYD